MRIQKFRAGQKYHFRKWAATLFPTLASLFITPLTASIPQNYEIFLKTSRSRWLSYKRLNYFCFSKDSSENNFTRDNVLSRLTKLFTVSKFYFVGK